MLAILSHPAFPSFPTRSCRDLHDQCTAWAASGECARNVGFMKLHACRRSCGSCAEDASDLLPQLQLVDESFMTTPRHGGGSCARVVPSSLRWGADAVMARSIGCFNRRGAEPSGSWQHTALAAAATAAATAGRSLTFYDSTSRRPLFVVPRNRTMADFLAESQQHGWPSFREEELVVHNLRVLRGTGGEVVSVDGVHLGHNLPDARSRFCINLVSIAGEPPDDGEESS